MAKANQYHQSGNTFRRTTSVKIPLRERMHNKDKWKTKGEERKKMQKARIKEKRGSWFKRKIKEG